MASMDRREAADLVVVGGSVAGLVTAIAAADHGHRVVLLERAKELGGGAATVAESIAAAGTRFQRVADVADEPARLLADLADYTHDDADAALARALVPQSGALVEWLADRCGAPIALQSTKPAGGHTAARLHAVGDQGGATLAGILARAASHHTHVRLRTLTEAERLLVDESGGVVGVAVRPDRRGGTMVAGPVVLACGGFAADDTLVAQHRPELAAIPYLGPSGAKGDALRLASPTGAAVRHLDACAVTALLAQPSHLAVPRVVMELGGILVSQRGERFIDESIDALSLARGIRAQAGGLAYVIFDEKVAAAAGANDPFFARVILPRTARRAGSLTMLAKQLSLAESGLVATLDACNATRTTNRLEPPLYGVRVTSARTATRGGLATDDGGRVLGAEGAPIPGLYAVGTAAAGLTRPDGNEGLEGIDPLVTLGLARLAALGLAPITEET